MNSYKIIDPDKHRDRAHSSISMKNNCNALIMQVDIFFVIHPNKAFFCLYKQKSCRFLYVITSYGNCTAVSFTKQIWIELNFMATKNFLRLIFEQKLKGKSARRLHYFCILWQEKQYSYISIFTCHGHRRLLTHVNIEFSRYITVPQKSVDFLFVCLSLNLIKNLRKGIKY